jgi:hypothetical protein
MPRSHKKMRHSQLAMQRSKPEMRRLSGQGPVFDARKHFSPQKPRETGVLLQAQIEC